MPTDVIMPQMGESIVEGTITKWLKQVGESVEGSRRPIHSGASGRALETGEPFDSGVTNRPIMATIARNCVAGTCLEFVLNFSCENVLGNRP